MSADLERTILAGRLAQISDIAAIDAMAALSASALPGDLWTYLRTELLAVDATASAARYRLGKWTARPEQEAE